VKDKLLLLGMVKQFSGEKLAMAKEDFETWKTLQIERRNDYSPPEHQLQGEGK